MSNPRAQLSKEAKLTLQKVFAGTTHRVTCYSGSGWILSSDPIIMLQILGVLETNNHHSAVAPAPNLHVVCSLKCMVQHTRKGKIKELKEEVSDTALRRHEGSREWPATLTFASQTLPGSSVHRAGSPLPARDLWNLLPSYLQLDPMAFEHALQ